VIKTKTSSFRLYWLNGETEIVEGLDIADAFRKAGYGAGAMSGLDFYSEKVKPEWEWDKESKIWKRIEE